MTPVSTARMGMSSDSVGMPFETCCLGAGIHGIGSYSDIEDVNVTSLGMRGLDARRSYYWWVSFLACIR